MNSKAIIALLFILIVETYSRSISYGSSSLDTAIWYSIMTDVDIKYHGDNLETNQMECHECRVICSNITMENITMDNSTYNSNVTISEICNTCKDLYGEKIKTCVFTNNELKLIIFFSVFGGVLLIILMFYLVSACYSKIKKRYVS
jgi:uncharacterized MnhB-related membrane protein